MSADARRSINRRLALTKQADGKGLIGETLGRGINAARGYFGLLGGGNVAKIRKGLETTRRRIGRTNEILKKEIPVVGEMPTKTLRADVSNTWLNRTLDRLSGRKRAWDKWEAAAAKWQPRRDLYSGLQRRLSAREAELAQALTKEREAVAKTRILTGIGALGTGGAGYGVYNALQDGEKKAAEAAFIQGFCKAAEAAGVDPVALYKQAAGSSDHSTANAVSEVAGFSVPLLLNVLSRRSLLRGRIPAAVAYGHASRVAGLGNLGGAIAAAVKKSRTDAAQGAYDSKLHVLRNLIPGAGSYNMFKRIGHKINSD